MHLHYIKNNVNNNNEKAQVLIISRLVHAGMNLSWLYPWVDHGKHFIVAPPSAQVWLHHWS